MGNRSLRRFDRCSAGDEHPCEARTSCQDCTGDEACGWCASSGRCLDGGGAGPSGGTSAARGERALELLQRNVREFQRTGL